MLSFIFKHGFCELNYSKEISIALYKVKAEAAFAGESYWTAKNAEL